MAISESTVIALYLKEHPNAMIYDSHNDTYFKYDPLTNKFLYRKPSNKKLNSWYEARGLKYWLYAPPCDDCEL